MKKLLGLLSAFVFAATTSLPVVACSIGNSVNESIDPVLEQQNFNVLNEWTKDKSKSLYNFLVGSDPSPDNDAKLAKDFFYSNGADGDNKYIADRSDSIEGSFNAGQWPFIDLLNNKLDLSLERNADKDSSLVTNPKTVGDVEKGILFKVNNIEELNKVKITNVTGSYQENGNSPVNEDGKDQKVTDETIDAFNKIINLGNTDAWKDIEEPGTSKSNPAWKKELAFINSADKEFVNRTYTKTTTVSYGDKSFSFIQIIMLQNVGALSERIGERVERAQNDFDKLGSKLTSISKDEFMNDLFSKMNVFTASAQDYSVSINLDCNYLYSQLDKAVTNDMDIINSFINNKNEQILGQFFIDQIDSWKPAKSNSIDILDDNKSTPLSSLDGKFNTEALDIPDLINNDILFKTFKVTSSASLKEYLSNWNISLLDINLVEPLSNYKRADPAAKELKDPDVDKLLDDMKQRVDKTVFTSDANKQAVNNKTVTFAVNAETSDNKTSSVLTMTTTGIDFKFSN